MLALSSQKQKTHIAEQSVNWKRTKTMKTNAKSIKNCSYCMNTIHGHRCSLWIDEFQFIRKFAVINPISPSCCLSIISELFSDHLHWDCKRWTEPTETILGTFHMISCVNNDDIHTWMDVNHGFNLQKIENSLRSRWLVLFEFRF